MTTPGPPVRLPLARLLAYAAPGFTFALLLPPFPAILATFYATYTAAGTAAIATILLLTRVGDAFVDVGIGIASDATRTRFGARKPWLLLGTVLAMLSFLVSFRPPVDASTGYFTVAIVIYYLAIGTFQIPMAAWAGELTTDYLERSRIAAYWTVAMLLGGVFFLLLPNLLVLPAIGLVKTSEIDLTMMSIYGWIGVVTLPLLVAIAVIVVPHGQSQPQKSVPFAQMVRDARGNRPFWLLIAAEVCSQVAWGIIYGVLFIALDKYYGLGPQVALLLLVATFAQILAVPVCAAIARRIGKHRTWGWAAILGALCGPLFLLFPPDGQANVPLLGLLLAVSSVFGTPNMMFPIPMVNDIADYDTLKSGQARAGSYYALRLLIFKATFAIGGSVGLYMLSAVGFDPKAATNTDFARHGLLFALVGLPNLLFLVAGFILLRFPIDARRHAIIRRRIEARQRRTPA